MRNSNKVIIKLNVDTKSDTIKWRIVDYPPSSLGGSEQMLGRPYICKVHDDYIMLYKYEEKYYMDEHTYEWNAAYRLEIVDIGGISKWEFPSDPAIKDLYETVQYKTSNAEDFFKKYLEE